MTIFSRFMGWVDARLPVTATYKKHMSEYYAPKNFNFWYYFGVLSLFVLVNQLLTGVWLTMFYTPDNGFASVAYIMRDVQWGWLIRYMHAVGASAFFAVVYIHMFRGLMYGSYKAPRELIWIFGMLIYTVMMAEGFMGYVLPWGNMSYWGAQVIISLVGAVPWHVLPFIDGETSKNIGVALTTWIRGDFTLSTATVGKFFALHVVALPIVLLALVVLHLLALHEVGSNNPDGVEIKKNKDENGIPKDGIPFHPYYTVKDSVGVIFFLMIFCTIIFFFPEGGGYLIEAPNFVPANPTHTPAHIAPSWYFGPYYAILRATTFNLFGINAKSWGLIAMAGAIVVLYLVPWLDRNPIRSIRYKGWISKICFILFGLDFLFLGYLGTQEATDLAKLMAQIGEVYYFLFFFLVLPFAHRLENVPYIGRFEQPKPVPERITGGH